MKSQFNGVDFFPIETLPADYGETEAKKAIRNIFDNLDDDSEDMDEIKKEKLVSDSEDLSDED